MNNIGDDTTMLPERQVDTHVDQLDKVVETVIKKREAIYQVDEEHEIEQVVTTLGGTLDVSALGIEVTEQQKTSLAYRVGEAEKISDKSFETITKEGSAHEQAVMRVMNYAFMSNILGSVWDKHRKALSPTAGEGNWKSYRFDIDTIRTAVRKDLADPMKIDRTGFSPEEQSLYTFFLGGSAFAKSMLSRYTSFKTAEEQGMIGMMQAWNDDPEQDFLARPRSQEEKDTFEKVSDIFSGKFTKDDGKNLATYLGIAVGGVLGLKALGRIGRKLGLVKEKEEKKGRSWRQKLLAGLGITSGLGWLARKFFNARDKKDDEGGPAGPVAPPEDEVDNPANSNEILKIHPLLASKANATAEHINTYWSPISGSFDVLGTDDWDTEPGAAVYALSSAGTVQDILSSRTELAMLAKASPNLLTSLFKNITLEGRSIYRGWIQSFTAWIPDTRFTPDFLLKCKQRATGEVNELNLDKTERENLHIMFRKLYKSLHWLQRAQEELQVKVVHATLAQGTGDLADKYKQLTNEDEKKAFVEDYREELVVLPAVTQVMQTFLSSTLFVDAGEGDGYNILKQYDALQFETDPALVDIVTDNTEQKDEDVALLSEMTPENLDVDAAIDICDTIIESMEEGGEIFWSKWFPIASRLFPLTNAWAHEEDMKVQMLESFGYDKIAASFVKTAQALKDQLQGGTGMSQEDIISLKELRIAQSDMLNEFLVFTEIHQENYEDEHGNTISNIYAHLSLPVLGNALLQKMSNLGHAYTKFWGHAGDTVVGGMTLDLGKTAGGVAGVTAAAVQLEVFGLFIKQPLRNGVRTLIGRSPAGKVVYHTLDIPFKVSRFPFQVTDALTGRRLSAALINVSPGVGKRLLFQGAQGEKLFRRYLMQGRLSESSIASIMKYPPWGKALGRTSGYHSLSEYVQSTMHHVGGTGLGRKEAERMARLLQGGYTKNTHIWEQLITSQVEGTSVWEAGANKANILKKGKYNFFLKDPALLKRLGEIDATILAMGKTTPDFEACLSLMKHTKNLDTAEELVKTWNTVFAQFRTYAGVQMTPESFFTLWKGSPKEFGKLLAHVDDVTDIPRIVTFIQDAQKAGKITHHGGFVRNIFTQWKTLKAGGVIDYADLNTPKGLFAAAEKGRTVVAKGVEVGKETLEATKKLYQASKAKLLARMQHASFPFKHLLPTYTATFNQYDAFFEEPGIIVRALESLGEKVMTPLGKIPKSAVAKIEQATAFLQAHPQILKYTKRVFAAAGVIFGGVEAYGDYQKAAEMRVLNPDKVDLYMDKAVADLSLAVVGAGLLFVPGVGWVAGGALLVGETALWMAKDAYFDVIDAYKTNEKERLKKGREAKQEALQHLMSTQAGQLEIERSYSDSFTRLISSKDFKFLTDKTGSAVISAWLLMDEIEKDPSGIGMIHFLGREQEDEITKQIPPDVQEQWTPKVVEIMGNVEKRVMYLKAKFGEKTVTEQVQKSRQVMTTAGDKLSGSGMRTEYYTVDGDTIRIVDWQDELGQALKVGHGQDFLLQQLTESRLSLQGDTTHHDPEANQERLATMGNEVLTDARFGPLKDLFYKDRRHLLYLFYASKGLLAYGEEAWQEEYAQASENMAYFEKFITYMSWYNGWDITPLSYSQDALTHDSTFVKGFLLKLDMDYTAVAPIVSQERATLVPRDTLWMQQEMQTSPNIVHNILYDIATEVYGMHLDNTIDDLRKIFSEERGEQYGIYLYENDMKIGVSDADWRDHTSSVDKQEHLLVWMRDAITKEMQDDDLINTQTGSGEHLINQEMGKKYLQIINRYYNRLWVNEGNTKKPNYGAISFALDACACEHPDAWFQLPTYDVATGMMLRLENIGTYLFKQDSQGNMLVRSQAKGEQWIGDVFPQLSEGKKYVTSHV